MSTNMTLVMIEDFIIAHPLIYVLSLILVSAILTKIIQKLDFWEALAIMTLMVYIMNYASIRAGVTLIRIVYDFWEFIIKQVCSLL